MAEQGKDKEHGEGNYKASRQYDDATKRFIDSGRVDDAARNAQPGNPDEERDMAQAEQQGKSRAKGEDPALHKQHDGGPATVPPGSAPGSTKRTNE